MLGNIYSKELPPAHKRSSWLSPMKWIVLVICLIMPDLHLICTFGNTRAQGRTTLLLQ